MPKKRRLTSKLGLNWKTMQKGDTAIYHGTYAGLKSNVCRANRDYKPKRFKLVHLNAQTIGVTRLE